MSIFQYIFKWIIIILIQICIYVVPKPKLHAISDSHIMYQKILVLVLFQGLDEEKCHSCLDVGIP